MKLREFRSVLACVIGLTGVSGAVSRGDEPPPAQAAAQVAEQRDAATQLLGTFLIDADGDTDLDFVTATYANPLAVEVADLEAALRTQLGTEEGVGVVVTSVGKGPDGSKSGLQQHDVVLQFGQEKIVSAKQFHEQVGSRQEKTVEFHVIRKGKPINVSVAIPKRPVYQILDANPSVRRSAARWLALSGRKQPRLGANHLIWNIQGAIGEPSAEVGLEQHYRIGLTLSEADDPLRSQLRLAAGEGLVVTDVVIDSPASRAGIQKNDVLVKLDGKRLTTVEAINAQIQEIKDRKVAVALFRAGNEIVCEVTPRLSKETSYRHAVLSEINSLIELRYAEQTGRAALFLIAEPAAQPATGSTPAEQLAVMKKQIAELPKSLEALEAALQTAAPSKPAAPEEKK